MRLSVRSGVVLAGAALLASMVAAAPVAGSAPAEAGAAAGHHPSWHTSWAASQQRLADDTLTDQSVRTITHLSQGGDAVRIRIQNQFGAEPLHVGHAAVALSDGDSAAVRAGSTRAVSFAGRASTTIRPGGEVWSDPVRLRTTAQADLAVSLYLPDATRPGQHDAAFRHNYLTPAGSGDHVADPSGAAYTDTVDSTYLVSAVDVRNPQVRGTIVAYGSSVVDGTGSTNCGPGCTRSGNNQRWTDDLARRIGTELPAGQQLTVANAGIGGTTSSTECPDEPSGVVGLEAGPRLSRDVLALHGVTGVIFFYGTNDLADHCTAAQILASYRSVFRRLHDAGIEVYVVASTPRPSYTDQMNRYRWDVGNYVANQGSCGQECDGVIDFDQAIKDAVHPNSIDPAYDNGDGVHVNIAGHRAEAATISLPMLLSSTRH